jgi:hypothetical protein
MSAYEPSPYKGKDGIRPGRNHKKRTTAHIEPLPTRLEIDKAGRKKRRKPGYYKI